MQKIKEFVLDTNVILHDCQAIFKFEEHRVILPMTVIEEIDHFKKEMNELGRNARHFSNLMDELREKGSLSDGVPVNEQGGWLQVVFCTETAMATMPDDMLMHVADNRILAITKHLSEDARYDTILVSKDTNLRIKADALGIKAETYENGTVDFDDLYGGVRDVLDELPESFNPPLHENEFVRVVNGYTGETISLYKVVEKYAEGFAALLPVAKEVEAWGLKPRNDEQRMALELLLDDNIKLVTLVGKAGTGKTLVAIAAGLQKVTPDFVYRKLLVARPVVPMGNDIGYLPGDIMDKLAPYMMPIYDNVEYLMAGYSITESPTAYKPKVPKKAKSAKPDNDPYAKGEKDDAKFDKGYKELLAAGIMEVEPLTYIRGRSIPNQYLIIDEAQNLTPHEIKTIITRAGEGTKIILTGDPYQIDNPYVDASSNGLSYAVDRFKDSAIAGHITLTKGERSELAEIASNLL